ncbi:MAG: hypothetical protein LBC97_07635 [Bifidobacteriaceae bacterium]|nr:hypothetical protein [Bifidobacteriaceae bacterium]
MEWAPSRPPAGTPAARLIASLIPECRIPVAPDMRAALDQRANIIRQRAAHLAQHAIRNNHPWIQELGPKPNGGDTLRRWQGAATAIAAYRDRWNHQGPTATRPRATSQQERTDAARVRRAVRRPVPATCGGQPPAWQRPSPWHGPAL